MFFTASPMYVFYPLYHASVTLIVPMRGHNNSSLPVTNTHRTDDPGLGWGIQR